MKIHSMSPFKEILIPNFKIAIVLSFLLSRESIKSNHSIFLNYLFIKTIYVLSSLGTEIYKINFSIINRHLRYDIRYHIHLI